MSALPAPAWFPDPSQPGQLRWWDGTAWTDHVHAAAAAEPSGAATQSHLREITRDAQQWTSFPDRVTVRPITRDEADVAALLKRRRRIDILFLVGVVAASIKFFVLVVWMSMPILLLWAVATGRLLGRTDAALTEWARDRGLEPLDTGRSKDWREPFVQPLRAVGFKRKVSRARGATGRLWGAAPPGTTIAEYSFHNGEDSSISMSIVAIPLPDAVAARYPGVSIELRNPVTPVLQDRAWQRQHFERDLGGLRVHRHPNQEQVALFELLDVRLVDHLASCRPTDASRLSWGFVIASGMLLAWHDGRVFDGSVWRAAKIVDLARVEAADRELETWLGFLRVMHRRLLEEYQ